MVSIMVELTKLLYGLIIECPPEYADEIGEDIAHDLLNELYNSEDVIEVEYYGYELLDEKEYGLKGD